MAVLRTLVRLFLVALIGLIVAGCGGGEPVTMEAVPVPPDAQPLSSGQNSMADLVAESFEQALTGENVTVEVNLYTLPADASWEGIKSYYDEQLAGTDWEAAPELNQDSEALKVTGWTRGGLASEQGLAIGYGPALLDNEPFIMVALISE